MTSGDVTLVSAYQNVFTAALLIMAVMIVLCLLRAILGPRVADRIVAINMMGTLVMVVIAVLSLKQNEGFLADICMIYAMTSFLAVIVLTKVFMGIYRERKHGKKENEGRITAGSEISAHTQARTGGNGEDA